MKKLLPFITFACLTAYTATVGSPVIAGGCSGNRNKATELKCDKDDKECQAKNIKKFDLNEAIKS